MTISNASLYFNFAAADAARQAQGDRGVEDSLASQLRKAALDAKFEPGTTVNARYQYRVAADGSLIVTKTEITAQVPRSEGRVEGRFRRSPRSEEQRQPRFNDYAAPKPQLAPAAEAELYAVSIVATPDFGAAVRSTPRRPTVPAFTQAVDENGAAVEAEIFIPNETKSDDAAGNTAQVNRLKYTVATLYARTGSSLDVPLPAIQLAA